MGNKQSKLDKPTLELIQKNTRFEQKQIQQWYYCLTRYKGFQKDFPGPISRQDFTKIYKSYFPFGDPNKYAMYVFNHLDLNKDGTLDFVEFMKCLDISSKGSLEERLNWSFSLFDLDEDGMISRAEMLAIVDSIYRMVGDTDKLSDDERTAIDRVDKIFKTMDLDGDGYLSKQEFIEGGKHDPVVLNALNLYSGVL